MRRLFLAFSSAFSHARPVFGFTCDSSFSQAMLLRLLCYAQCASRLGTGRHLLAQMDVCSFPIHQFFCFSLIRSSAQADDGYSKSVGRIRAKHGLTHRHRLCKKNERVAICLTRLDAVFSHARSVFGFTCDSFFSKAMPLRQLCSLCSHNAQAALDVPPSAGADGRLFFSHSPIFLFFSYTFIRASG